MRPLYSTTPTCAASASPTAADFTKAKLSRVDLRGSDLADLRGSLLGLGAAVVDSLQLMDLAAQLAAELGIQVEQA